MGIKGKYEHLEPAFSSWKLLMRERVLDMLSHGTIAEQIETGRLVGLPRKSKVALSDEGVPPDVERDGD